MKYVIDTNALKDCLDLIKSVEVNGHDYVAVHNVKLLIDRFPKEVYDLGFDYLVSEGEAKREEE